MNGRMDEGISEGADSRQTEQPKAGEKRESKKEELSGVKKTDKQTTPPL